MKKCFSLFLFLVLCFCLCPTTYAHTGNTDSSGGHRDSSTGEYHYHHGYPAHEHEDLDGDGMLDCPYNFKDATDDTLTRAATEGWFDTTNPTPKPKSVPETSYGTSSNKLSNVGDLFDKSFSFIVGVVLLILMLSGYAGFENIFGYALKAVLILSLVAAIYSIGYGFFRFIT